ncbi:Prenyltransferase [Vulgatibacter incomptus]|uniref:Prenyltransferase n=1 Tax=Vulgatibacter incomptus TaxID=1391653 RepID=A0A0K1P8T5_9BACT|nr:Prenyltransferase [Vulgatibacter incomptus]
MLRHLGAGMRPHQWVKNGFLFAPLVFAHKLFEPALLLRSVAAFFLYSLMASAVYLGNDVLDVEADRRHPVKRNRPIASGKLPASLAAVVSVVLALGSLTGAALLVPELAGVLLAYLVMNAAYSWRLKKLAYVDVCVIALGFVLRVLAGTVAIGVPPSNWIFLCTFALALFLGFGKRKHELLSAQGSGRDAATTRKALGAYTLANLDIALAGAGALAVVSYFLYTVAPDTLGRFGYLLAYTLPFPAFGIWRFTRLVAHATRASSPTEALITDPPFVLNLAVWMAAVVAIVY